jgi:hypothetical protein
MPLPLTAVDCAEQRIGRSPEDERVGHRLRTPSSGERRSTRLASGPLPRRSRGDLSVTLGAVQGQRGLLSGGRVMGVIRPPGGAACCAASSWR